MVKPSGDPPFISFCALKTPDVYLWVLECHAIICVEYFAYAHASTHHCHIMIPTPDTFVRYWARFVCASMLKVALSLVLLSSSRLGSLLIASHLANVSKYLLAMGDEFVMSIDLFDAKLGRKNGAK